LLDTISYVSDMVDEIERITNILEGKWKKSHRLKVGFYLINKLFTNN
jgi:hypothetical protein